MQRRSLLQGSRTLGRISLVSIIISVMALILVGSTLVWSHLTTHAATGQQVTFTDLASQTATITFNANGIPTVTASTYQCAVAALGYAEASQRLYEMEQFVWTTNGTLSSYLGAGPQDEYESSDELLATLDLTDQANSIYASSQQKPILQAYAAGVNQYIGTHSLPYEFGALGIHSLPRWTPQDSMDIMVLTTSELNIGKRRS